MNGFRSTFTGYWSVSCGQRGDAMLHTFLFNWLRQCKRGNWQILCNCEIVKLYVVGRPWKPYNSSYTNILSNRCINSLFFKYKIKQIIIVKIFCKKKNKQTKHTKKKKKKKENRKSITKTKQTNETKNQNKNKANTKNKTKQKTKTKLTDVKLLQTFWMQMSCRLYVYSPWNVWLCRFCPFERWVNGERTLNGLGFIKHKSKALCSLCLQTYSRTCIESCLWCAMYVSFYLYARNLLFWKTFLIFLICFIFFKTPAMILNVSVISFTDSFVFVLVLMAYRAKLCYHNCLTWWKLPCGSELSSF